MIKTIIFDMDGVLIDSIPAHYLAWKKLFQPYGNFTWEEFVPLIGISTKDTAILLKSKFNAPVNEKFLAKEKDRIYHELSHEIKLFPKIPLVLNYLKDKKITSVVATSEPTEVAIRILKNLSILHFFENIIGRDQVTYEKPAPDIFLKAAEKSNTLQSECIVVEDSVSGIKAGKKAGMKVIGLTTTTKPELLYEADIVTNDLFKTLSTLDYKNH